MIVFYLIQSSFVNLKALNLSWLYSIWLEVADFVANGEPLERQLSEQNGKLHRQPSKQFSKQMSKQLSITNDKDDTDKTEEKVSLYKTPSKNMDFHQYICLLTFSYGDISPYDSFLTQNIPWNFHENAHILRFEMLISFSFFKISEKFKQLWCQ